VKFAMLLAIHIHIYQKSKSFREATFLKHPVEA